MIKRYAVAALAGLVALLPLSAQPASELPAVLAPYLQNPTTDGMTICLPARSAEAVRVAWGLPGQPLTETPATAVPVDNTPWTVWRTRLTGLKAGTRASYEVRYRLAGAEAKTPLYSFQTLRPAGQTVRFAVVNDLHDREATLTALTRQLKPEDYDFSILLGDCIADPKLAGGAPQVFRDIAAYTRLLHASDKSMLLVRGNHETRSTFARQLAQLFDLPLLDRAAKWGDDQWQFTLRSGALWLLAMDTGEDDDLNTPADSYKAPQLWQAVRRREADWLRGALAAKPARDDAWRVLVSHIPVYDRGHSVTAQTYWAPQLAGAGFDLMLAGHTHAWKVTPRADNDQPPATLVVGGGPDVAKATLGLYTVTDGQLTRRLLAADGTVLAEDTSLRRRRPAMCSAWR